MIYFHIKFNTLASSNVKSVSENYIYAFFFFFMKCRNVGFEWAGDEDL